jgi:TIR domain
MQPWDLFISHASEDKELFVNPLSTRLRELAVRVWYDKFTLLPGDRLSEKIGEGLAKSRGGLLVISKAFLSKPWTSYELSGLINRFVEEQIPLIPIWIDVSRADVSAKNPALADLLSIKGTPNEIDRCALEIIRVIRPQLYDNFAVLSAGNKSTFKMGKVRLSDMKSGPIRHHDLPDSILIRIQNIWLATNDVFETSLKQSIENFQRDLQPEKEVEIWERIVGALQIASNCLYNGNSCRREIFSILLRFSLGDNEQVFEDVGNGKLSEEIVRAAAQAWLAVVPNVTVPDVEQTGK